MTQAVTSISHTFSTPYLTVAEYKQAPTSIDYSNLVTGSTDPAVQDAELANVIARASSWMDNYCNQILGATNDTEQRRARISNDGTIRVHPDNNPVLAVTDFAYGFATNSLTSLSDCSSIWIEDQSFVVPLWQSQLSWSSQGPLQFGLPSSPRANVYIRYTYVNGYASTLLTANASAGATSITVKSGIGFLVGDMFTIYDGLATEQCVVDSSYVFGSTTIPLASPLSYAHTSGVAVSSLPPVVKEAAILVTTAFIKMRGDSSMTMQVSNLPTRSQAQDTKAGSELYEAQEMLKSYRRIK